MKTELNEDQKRAIANAKQKIAEVCNRIPVSVRDGSFNITADWKKARIAALKTAAKPSVTYHQLQSAISAMEAFK